MISVLNLSDSEQVNQVMDIWLAGNLYAHSFVPERHWRTNFDQVKTSYLPQSVTTVWEEDGQIYGFLSLVDNRYIGALFVKEGHRGKGIGRKLLEDCMQQHNKLSLCAYAENARAVKFYRNMGFQIMGQQTGDDGFGQVEYKMEWVK